MHRSWWYPGTGRRHHRSGDLSRGLNTQKGAFGWKRSATWQRQIILFVMFSLALIAAGCFGPTQRHDGPVRFGTIVGQVVDDDTGRGVPGILVSVEGQSVAVMTDDDGRYTLEDVPAGARTVVVQYPDPAPTVAPMSSVAPLMLDVQNPSETVLLQNGEPIPFQDALDQFPTTSMVSKTLHIEVRANTTHTVEPMYIPVFGAVDNLFLYHTAPRVGQTAPAHELMRFVVDAHYSLQSEKEGFVVLIFSVTDPHGDVVIWKQESFYIPRGVSNAIFDVVVDRPDHARLGLHLALTDRYGQIISLKSYGHYTIRGGSVPLPPTLEVIGFSDHALRFRLILGSSFNFIRYVLHSSSSSIAVSNPSCLPAGIWSSEDWDVESIEITAVSEGSPIYYWLCLHGRGYEAGLPSNVVAYEVPRYGIKDLRLNALILDIIPDPNQDVMYVADGQGNEVLVLSVTDDKIIDRIPVGPGPKALAITDDRRLIVGHQGGTVLAVVDLSERKVIDWILDVPRVTGIAVDTSEDVVYAVYDEGDKIRAIHLHDHSTIWDMDTPSRIYHMKLDNDRVYLHARNEAWAMNSKDPQDIVQLDGEASLSPRVVSGDGLLFRGHLIHDAATLTRLDDFPSYIVASNMHGDRLYGFGGFEWGTRFSELRTFYEHEWDPDTETWVQTVRFPLTFWNYDEDVFSVSSNGDYLYFASRFELMKVDLSKRRGGTP